MDFENKAEIGTFLKLTNNYIIVGTSQCELVMDFLKEKVSFPIIQTTIGEINTIGALCAGNKNGLLVSQICTDAELLHIRNSLPPEIKLLRIEDSCKAIGNNILCNDHFALVNPEFTNTEEIERILQVPVYKISFGKIGLVGSYGVLNSKGLIVHTEVNKKEIEELSDLTKTNVMASTINQGKMIVGSGMVANDFICIAGVRSTNVELKVAENVFGLSDEEFDKREIVEEIATK